MYPKCDEYSVKPGRVIVCKETDEELFTVHRNSGLSPSEADAMAHYIASSLNERKDFNSYYKQYMRK